MVDAPVDGPTHPFLRGRHRAHHSSPTLANAATLGLGVGAWAPSQARPAARTPRLSARDARRLLEAPDPSSLQGLRDRAILAVGLYLGATRTEIAALRVRDFQVSGGLEYLRLPLRRVTRRLPVPPAVARRLEAYLATEGHARQPDAPLFRVVRRSARARHGATGLRPPVVDQVVRKYAARLGLGRGYGMLSLRATYLSPAMHDVRTHGLAPDEARPGASLTA